MLDKKVYFCYLNEVSTPKLLVLRKLLVLFFSLFSSFIFGQTAKKYSNEFMNIGVDAAAFGMSNTMVASTNDVNSGYWNPAGLMGINDRQAALMHASYFANIAQYDYAAFAMPIDDQSALGISMIRFGVDNILNTTQLILTTIELVYFRQPITD